MKKIRIDLQRDSYDIIINKGILFNCIDEISPYVKNKRVFLVCDDTVYKLYGENFKKYLEENNLNCEMFSFPNGEKSKNIFTLNEIYEDFLSKNITRSDLIIALGGGVTGDITGFASATILRGVDYIQIPTTLLSQVDSSVGGKTAIDTKAGKNLVGAFCQPKKVIIDPEVLKTLNDRIFFDGLCEVIKYGVICDKELFDKISFCHSRDSLYEIIEYIIYTSCDIKRRIVEKDQFDKGERMLLNLGHTLGHCYEKLGDYSKYTHGEAVAMGMYKIMEIGEKMGITKREEKEKLISLYNNFNISYFCPTLDKVQAEDVLSRDKKSDGEKINIVIPKTIGDTSIINLSKTEFFKYL